MNRNFELIAHLKKKTEVQFKLFCLLFLSKKILLQAIYFYWQVKSSLQVIHCPNLDKSLKTLFLVHCNGYPGLVLYILT